MNRNDENVPAIWESVDSSDPNLYVLCCGGMDHTYTAQVVPPTEEVGLMYRVRETIVIPEQRTMITDYYHSNAHEAHKAAQAMLASWQNRS